MATCAGNVGKPEISNRGRWLNKVSPKLSPTELNLLILSFVSEIPLGKLDKLVNASDLYSTLSDGCGFTSDEALQLLLRRMHLLGGNGRVCALEAQGFGIQHQESNEALDHKLSEESVLMECVVQTYRELPVVKQVQLTKYLAEKYLTEHPDNLSSFEVFSKLLYQCLLTPAKTEVLVDGLRTVNATTAAFKHLNDYYRQKGLQEISIPQARHIRYGQQAQGSGCSDYVYPTPATRPRDETELQRHTQDNGQEDNRQEDNRQEDQDRRNISGKICICMTAVIVGGLLAMLVLGILMLLLSTFVSSISDKEAYPMIRQGDIVLLDKTNPFWYDQVQIAEKVEDKDRYEVLIYKERCKDLIEYQNSTAVESRRFPILPPFPFALSVMPLTDVYLLPASTVSINATVWNTANVTSEIYFCIFEDLEDYNRFSDNGNRENALTCFNFGIDNKSHLFFFQENYTFPNPSYYYAGFSFASPLTIQYGVELQARSYNHSDYIPLTCLLHEDSFVIGLQRSNNIKAEQWCFLGYAPLPIAEELHISMCVRKRHRTFNTFFIAGIPILGLSATLLVCVPILAKSVHRRIVCNRDYDRVEQDEITAPFSGCCIT